MAIQVHFAFMRCITSDDDSTDECYVKWSGQRIWGPFSVEEGSAWDLDKFVLFQGDSDVVEIFDEETFGSDDRIGGHIIRRDELGQGWHKAVFRGEDAEYELDYEVFEG